MSVRRRQTRAVRVGRVVIGGGSEIVIQSMTTTTPTQYLPTLQQMESLLQAGCHLIRIAVPSVRAAEALGDLRRAMEARGLDTPLVADVHFSPRAALAAAEHVEKVRINPGNFAADPASAKAHLGPLLARLSKRGAALRIGVNHGSLARHIVESHGHGPAGMVASAMEYLRICRELGFADIVVSLKASIPATMVAANRLLVTQMDSEGFDYPLHLGVTEAGQGREGELRSAVGIAALLHDGIGDTIRVSLTGDPTREIAVCRAILHAIRTDTQEEIGSLRDDGVASDAAPAVVAPGDEESAGPVSQRWGVLPVGGSAAPRVELAVTLPAPSRGAAVLHRWIDRLCVAAVDERTPAESLLLDLGDLDARDGFPADLPNWIGMLRRDLEAAGAHPPIWIALGRDLPWWHARHTDRWVDPRLLPPFDQVLPRVEGIVLDVPAEVLGTDPDARRRSGVAWLVEVLRPLLAEIAGEATVLPLHLRWRLRVPEHPAEELSDLSRSVRLAGLGRALLGLSRDLDLPLPSFTWEARPVVATGRILASALAAPRERDRRPLLIPRLAGCDPADATTAGTLLLDGQADALTVAAESETLPPGDELMNPLRHAYALLQASRRRVTRVEFISCPGCGRLGYDLEATVQRLKHRLGHLRDLKIAVMGCAVNGPGEMADADFGYVGSVEGRVDLYVGRQRVARGLNPEAADKALIALLRDEGRWLDPT